MVRLHAALNWLSNADRFEDDDLRLRGRFLGVGLVLGGLAGMSLMAAYAVQGAWVDFGTAAVLVCTSLAALWWWRRFHDCESFVHFHATLLVLALGAVTVSQQDLTYIPFFGLVAVVAYFLGGARAGRRWSWLTLAVTLGLTAWFIIHPPPDPNWAPHLARSSAVVLLVTLLAYAFEHSRGTTIRRLADACARADAANQGKTRFLSAISHDLRTPLNGILGTLELARLEEGLSPVLQRHLSTIHDSGSTLVALINDLLDLSRAETGRLELSPGRFDLRRVAEQVVELHRARAAEKGLELHSSVVGADDVLLMGDMVRLQQVLHNLLGNAVKFTQEGAIWLSIRCARTPTGHWSVAFEVRDTGRGMTEREVAVLFTAFTQLRPSDARMGSGLGLAISRALVDQMGGKLSVTSTPGRGTTFAFQVELPEALPQLSAVETSSSAAPLARRSGRVLVVDDNPVNLRVASGLLHRMGLSVDVANGGLEALGLLERSHYDLVLMDLQMPDLDGAAATRRLRQTEGTARHTPVVALTASALPSELAQCLEAGMDATLTKPLQVQRLNEVIGAWLPAA